MCYIFVKNKCLCDLRIFLITNCLCAIEKKIDMADKNWLLDENSRTEANVDAKKRKSNECGNNIEVANNETNNVIYLNININSPQQIISSEIICFI